MNCLKWGGVIMSSIPNHRRDRRFGIKITKLFSGWQQVFGEARTRILLWYLLVYVGYLRKKLGSNIIETVRGMGYRLRT